MKWTKHVARLGENILRVECLPEGKKKIAPTFAIQSPEKFKRISLQKKGGREIFENRFFQVRLCQDGKRLNRKNLEVCWKHGNREYLWRPGKKDTENLGGPFFSLDLCEKRLVANRIHSYDPMKGLNAYVYAPSTLVGMLLKLLEEKLEKFPDGGQWQKEFQNLLNGKPPTFLESWNPEILNTLKKIRLYPPGLLSRSGVTIFLDDTLPWNPQKNWLESSRKIDSQALYFIHYGNDYKKGLKDLARILGDIPKVPSWVLGTWFSVYKKWGEKEFEKLKENFDKHELPLDVVVVDTDWHKQFWHGFDWNEKLFPDPGRFASWLKKHGLHAAFNVHPQFIPKKDTRLKEFLKRTGVPELYTNEKTAPHPFHKGCLCVNLFDKTQADAYFKVFHKPVEQKGCDLWWVDGGFDDGSGRNANTWLNHIYHQYSGQTRGKEKCPCLSRGYGLGAHRSCILFTGDTVSQWEVLEQEVIMTPLASNLLVAYTSHDIGGFLKDSAFRDGKSRKPNKPPDDLYIRWVQFGCLSPVFRFHSNHGIREPWRFKKQTLEIVRRFMQLRKKLLPYLKRLSNEAHKTGVGLCRPMYYEFPEMEEAYQFPEQYMLGDLYVVSPVTGEDGWKSTWIPPGCWRHCFRSQVISGPAVIKEKIPLETMPLYRNEQNLKF